MYRYVKRSSDLEEQAKEPAAVQALLVERRPVARVMSGGLESSLTNHQLRAHSDLKYYKLLEHSNQSWLDIFTQ